LVQISMGKKRRILYYMIQFRNDYMRCGYNSTVQSVSLTHKTQHDVCVFVWLCASSPAVRYAISSIRLKETAAPCISCTPIPYRNTVHSLTCSLRNNTARSTADALWCCSTVTYCDKRTTIKMEKEYGKKEERR
jgi:hypothetical protein